MGSLAVALGRAGEIVVASDRLGYVGDAAGYYKFDFGRKLRETFRRNWIFAFTGTELGEIVFDAALRQLPEVSAGIHQEIPELARRVRIAYKEYERSEVSDFMVAGVQDGKPVIYTWHAHPAEASVGPASIEYCSKFSAIGASKHGGLYFANSHLAAMVSTEQRILLAYFSVAEVGKHDPRVQGVAVGLARADGVKVFAEEDLAGVKDCTDKIARQFTTAFSEAVPQVGGL